MARRQQRRPRVAPPRGARKLDEGAAQAALDSSAQRLINLHDARTLQRMVDDLVAAHEEAERSAYDQPSPEALYTFRRARHELAVAKRALVLAEPDA